MFSAPEELSVNDSLKKDKKKKKRNKASDVSQTGMFTFMMTFTCNME